MGQFSVENSDLPGSDLNGNQQVADPHQGSRVFVYDNGGTIALGSGTVDGSGNWSANVVLPTNGSHVLIAQGADAVGNVGTSNAVADIYDTVAPIVSISTHGRTTNNSHPTIIGTVTDLNPGTVVSVFDNSDAVSVGSGTIDSNGNWSARVSLSGDGDHSLVVRSTDAAGNTGTSTAILDVLDTVAPIVAITSAPTLTNNTGPIVSGTVSDLHPSALVSVFDNGGTTAVGTGTIDGTGHWSFPVTLSGDGGHELTAVATDVAGNVGSSASAITFLDTTAPTIIVTTAGTLTNQAIQTLAGEPLDANLGSTYYVYDNGGATPIASGVWNNNHTFLSFNVAVTLDGDGLHSLVVKTTDNAGNTGSSIPVVFELDSTGPALTINSAPTLTNRAAQTITGTVADAHLGTVVSLFDNAGTTPLASGTIDSTGHWSIGVTLSGQGAHSLVARSTDALGNSGNSAALVDVFDTVAPSVAITSSAVLTGTPTLTVGGTASDLNIGSNVLIFDNGGTTAIGSGTIDGTGHWTSRITLSGDGDHSLVALAADLAGNRGFSAPVVDVLDTTAPTIAITSPTGLTGQPVQTITGTVSDPHLGATVSLYEDGATTAFATVNVAPDGTWSAPASLGADGAHTVLVRGADAVGNVGTTSASYVVDTTAPNVAISTPGKLTNQPTQTVSGTSGDLHPGTTVAVFDQSTGTTLGSAPVQSDGVWSTSITLSGDGPHSLVANYVDAAGNHGTSAAKVYTLDTVAPAVAVTSTGGLTNQTLQTVTGTGEIGTVIAVFDGNAAVGNTTVASDGTWTATVSLSGAQGNHAVSATDTDAAGNTGTSAAVTYTLDTIAPSVAITSTGLTTNQAVQTIAGTGEANTGIAVFDGTDQIGTATVGNDGHWSTSVTLSGEGLHVLSAADTDAAGNIGTSNTVNDILDLTPPVVAVISAGGLTNQRGQSISGTGEANTTVSVLDGAVVLTTATVDVGGNWNASVTLSGDGAHAISATDTDVAGNTGTSAAVGFVLDTLAPTVAIQSTGGLTNQVVQTVTGTGEAGTTINVFDGAVAIGSTTADLTTGLWSAKVQLQPGDGAHRLTVTDTDAAGNTGTSVAVGYVLDTLAPSVTITSAGLTTNVPTQVIRGTGEANTRVTLYDGTTAAGTALVAANGTWTGSITLSSDQGAHAVTAVDTDAAGNPGTSPAVVYTLDTVAPNVVINSPAGPTNRQTQTVTGIGEAGTVVSLFEGGTSLGRVTVAANGTWSKSVTLLPGQGAHSIVATDTDALGNVGTSTAAVYQLDTVAPSVTITSPGVLTNTRLQTITGTGDANTTVLLLNADTGLGFHSTSVAANGTWSTTITLPATQGTINIVARDTDSVGNVGTSTFVAYTLDTVAPVVAIGSSGQLTSQPLQTISGTASDLHPGATVSILDNGAATPVAIVTVAGDGTWSTPVTLVGDGAHNLTARYTDAAGNVATSGAASYNLDTTAPAVVITSAAGPVKNAALTVSGISSDAHPGSTIQLFDNGGTTSVGSAAVQNNGSWSTSITLVGEGAHSLVASYADALGNVGSSAPAVYTLDTVAPGVAITSAAGPTNHRTQTLSGTGEAGTFVRVYDGASLLSTTLVAGDNTWSTSATLLNGDGAHTVTATDTDAAGNIGTSSAVSYLLDTIAPAVSITSPGILTNSRAQRIGGIGEANTSVLLMNADTGLGFHSTPVAADGTWNTFINLPAIQGTVNVYARDTDAVGNVGTSTLITYTLDTVAPVVSINPGGGLTNQPAQTLSGTSSDLHPGTTVAILDNGGTIPVAIAAVQANGTWSTTVTLAGDGLHTLVASYTDAAGNVGTSASTAYMLDSTAPVVTITSPGTLTNTATQVVAGTATDLHPGSTVALFDNGASVPIGTTTVQSDGSWSTSVVLLGDGTHGLVAQYADSFGNIGASAPANFTLDTVAPLVAVTSTGGLTNTPGQLISGTGEAGTTVSVLDGAIVLATAIVPANGLWSAPVTLTGEGHHSLSATDPDAAGNIGTSNVIDVLLDATAPTVTIGSAGGLTNQPAQIISGTGEAGTVVQVLDGAVQIGSATVDPATGLWSVSATLVPGDGTHNITARDTDAAGNIGTSPTVAYQLDTAAPIVAITTGGIATKSPTQLIRGTGAAGTTVTVFDGATAVGSTVVAANRTWSTTITLTGAQGNHSVFATDTDAAGNVGTSAAIPYTLDTIAPAVAITSAAGLTNQASVTVSGTGEANTTIKIYDGATFIGQSPVASDGSWTKLVRMAATQGAHAITATDTDAVGNIGTSAASIYVLDTIAPAVTITSPGVLTNARSQAIAVTGEANTTVTLFDGAISLGTVAVGSDGTWNGTVTLSPAQGVHNVTASDTDAAGNVGKSAPVSYTLDTIAPVVTVGSSGGLTNQPVRPVFGTATDLHPGTTVMLYDNLGNTPVGSATIQSGGAWSTNVTLIGDGTHRLLASYTDAAGNVGTRLSATYTLDTTAPIVTITSSAGPTNQVMQTVAGTSSDLNPGTTVTLFDNGNSTSLATATVNPDGSWSTAAQLLGDGGHSIVASYTDAAGNTGTSTPAVYTLDETAPLVSITSGGGLTNQPIQTILGTGEAGTIVSILDGMTVIGTMTVDVTGGWTASVTLTSDGDHVVSATDIDAAGNVGASGAITFTLDTLAPVLSIDPAGGLTNLTFQTITGTGEAGTSISLFDGGTLLGSVTADPVTGAWSLGVPLLGGDGTHVITATDTDAASNVGTTAAVTYVLDTAAPAVAITTAGITTSNTTPLLRGTGEAGTTVTLYDGATAAGTAVVAANGIWSGTVTLTNDQGIHIVTAADVDAAGNIGTSAPVQYTLDTLAPAVAITSAAGPTNQTLVRVSGTGEPNTILRLYEGATLLGRSAVASDGTWSKVITTGAAQGAHVITATDTDAVGNVGTSVAATYLLDTIAPSVTITSPGVLTNTRVQTISGTGEANTSLSLYDGTSRLATIVVGDDGIWSGTFTLLNSQGMHAITARDSDAVGNVGTSDVANFNLDTVVPIVAIGTTGGATTQPVQTLAGTSADLHPGTTVQIIDNGTTTLGTAVVQDDGTWSTSVTLPGNGLNRITAKYADAAGNIGGSNAIIFNLSGAASIVSHSSTANQLQQQDRRSALHGGSPATVVAASASDTASIQAVLGQPTPQFVTPTAQAKADFVAIQGNLATISGDLTVQGFDPSNDLLLGVGLLTGLDRALVPATPEGLGAPPIEALALVGPVPAYLPNSHGCCGSD